MKIRVYYEDTDIGEVVYHANYIKFCERARSELFFTSNTSALISSEGGFVVKDLNANFFASATLGEILEVKTETQNMRSASILLKQDIYRGDMHIFSMNITLVYIKDGKPSKIPSVFKDIFELYS